MERLLLFNLATDDDDPILGFTSSWVSTFAERAGAVDVITMRQGSAELPPNVTVRSAGNELGYSRPRRVAVFRKHLRTLLHTNDYDGCFAHMIPVFAALGGLSLRRRSIPTILWYASGRLLPSLPLATAAANVVVSPSRESFPLARTRVAITGHGIDTELFRPVMRPRNHRAQIVSVGRISPVKRLELLIEACACLRDRGITADLRLVGPVYERADEDYARGLKRLISQRCLEGSVVIEDPHPFRTMPGVYSGADVFVSASATGSLDKAVLEAMSCGVPCVVTDSSARHLMMETGFSLGAEATPQSIADRLGYVLSLADPQRTELGKALRLLIVKKHSLNGLVDQLLDLFSAA